MKPVDLFSDEESRMVGNALQVSLGDDPIFAPHIFHTLTGIDHTETTQVLMGWPELDLEDKAVWRTVAGVLANLWGGFPHRQENRILAEIGLDRPACKQLRSKLNAVRS